VITARPETPASKSSLSRAADEPEGRRVMETSPSPNGSAAGASDESRSATNRKPLSTLDWSRGSQPSPPQTTTPLAPLDSSESRVRSKGGQISADASEGSFQPSLTGLTYSAMIA
jgi:hypothetical protein